MTIIAVTQGLVLADALRMDKDGKPYYQSGKIHTYSKPVRLRSTEQGFSDLFYGFAGSGEDEAIHAAGKAAGICQMDLWLAGYNDADRLRLLTDQTSFSIMFFGLNGVILAEIISGSISMMYYSYGDYVRLATGSGCAAWNRLMRDGKDNICPIRAMYGTFAMEPTCGGEIEVWALPNEAKGAFTKIATYPHRTLFESFRMAGSPKKFHHLKESKEWLKSLIPRLEQNSAKRSKGKTKPPPQGLLDLLYSTWSKRPPEP
ncbi:hypothetical protein [Xanthomonas phage RTH11]|nr:hypothetical protein [Xanthomonas phage RTH11]